MNERTFKSNQTRHKNINAKLKNELPPLYEKRWEILEQIKFFYSVNEDEKLPKLDVKELNYARAKFLIDLVEIDQEIQTICLKLMDNHLKYKYKLIKYKKALQEKEGFRIK